MFNINVPPGTQPRDTSRQNAEQEIKMLIAGAGLSGLIAANLLPDAHIIEASQERASSAHKAVLRFRGPDVGNALGIDFRAVTVHKGIWGAEEQRFVQPTIQLANQYSKKVVGRLGDRSIWKLEPSQRWIAPEDFYERLLARCKGRITWNASLESHWDHTSTPNKHPIISTIPMPAMLKIVGADTPDAPVKFEYAGIKVRRWRVKNADVFQTVYFADPNMPLYRASITGDMLIAEFIDNGGEEQSLIDELKESCHIFPAFGLAPQECERLVTQSGASASKQRFGKIAPIDDRVRREIILQLSVQHKVFSLGRFACWKNLLLDDVLKDLSTVKKLIDGDGYTSALHWRT